MCGFLCAIGNFSQYDSSLKQGLSVMSNRGPDHEGVFMSDSAWLGHKRLAIIDLDERSNQPFFSNCQRFIITFNGEIYNYKRLRDYLILKGVKLRTNSDTEVIIELYILEGKSCLSKLEGMFAFVIWDLENTTAFAARDPYGIKPLYYAKLNHGFIFSSQVKAIAVTELINKELNPKAISGYWMLGSIPDSCTIYSDVYSVLAGEYILLNHEKILDRGKWFEIGSVWLGDLEYSENKIPKNKILNDVKKIIGESVDRHIESDVPIGIFLSGGIDSGVLAGLLKERVKSSIIGITIAFEEFLGKQADESDGAKVIAATFGIQHHIRKVSKDEFIADLPYIFEAMDQPSIDGINTWYASKAASELGLKVVLSGIGGDELFLGYNNFNKLPLLVKYSNLFFKIFLIKKLVKFITKIIGNITGNGRWNYFSEWSSTISGAWWLSRSTMCPASVQKIINNKFSGYLDNFSLNNWILENTGQLANDSTIALAQIESTMYLRNQLLKDSDWASMFHSVELRTPFVDAKLLIELKPFVGYLKNFPRKELLCKSLSDKKLPKIILKRRKTGFSIPVNDWINEFTNSHVGWQKYVYDRYFDK